MYNLEWFITEWTRIEAIRGAKEKEEAKKVLAEKYLTGKIDLDADAQIEGMFLAVVPSIMGSRDTFDLFMNTARIVESLINKKMLLEPLPKDADEEWRKRITHTEINIKAVKAYAVEWAKTLADEVLKKGLGAEKQVVEKMQSKRIELLTMADKVGATRYIEEAIKILEVGKTKKENRVKEESGNYVAYFRDSKNKKEYGRFYKSNAIPDSDFKLLFKIPKGPKPYKIKSGKGKTRIEKKNCPLDYLEKVGLIPEGTHIDKIKRIFSHTVEDALTVIRDIKDNHARV